MLMIFAVFFPVLAGLAMLKLGIRDRKRRERYVIGTLAVTLAATVAANITGGQPVTIAAFSSGIDITLQADALAKFFTLIFAAIWLLVGIFAQEYMKHEGEENRFFAFFIASLGGLLGVAYADNLVTMYRFFEAMSIMSYVLVPHSRTNESLIAGRKYIYYSLFGASLGLIGIFYFYSAGWERAFVEGGVIPAGEVSAPVMSFIVILAIVGFGCKCGMFPLHGWLPAAHPQAPAPASSVLSGLITKAGVIAIIRIVYYTVGAENIRGTAAQYAILALSIVTIFMGSMLAYKEKVLKKRLAYSTVSQVSYVIFGLMLLNAEGFTGALLQVVFHALAKNVLFLGAGAFIYKTGKTMVSDTYAMGKAMPKTLACFSVAGLSLVGVPLTAGYVSKHHLAFAALEHESGLLGFIGLCTIMISALLTAGYLVTITAKAFFAPKEDMVKDSFEPNAYMTVPMAFMTAAIVLFGIYPRPVINFAHTIANSLFI